MSQALNMNLVFKSLDEEYHSINDKVCDMFGFSEKQKGQWESSKIIELLIKLPYLAGCQNPKKLAIIHLMLFHASLKSTSAQDFLPITGKPADMTGKLKTIMAFEDGTQHVIDKGLFLLALAWMGIHKNNFDGHKNFERTATRLVKEINKIPCPEVEEIVTVMEAYNNLWSY